MKDYYSILGIDKKASSDEIKKAYRRLAHQFHPDKAGGNEEHFKEINEAYYVLSDAKRRKQYDHFGVGPGSQRGAGAYDFSGFPEGFETWFSDIVEEFFGGASAGAGRRGTRGRDIAVELTVSLEQVLHGVREEVSVVRWVACDRCKGGGGEPGSAMKTCSTCSGAGRLHRVEQTFFGAMTRLVRCPECHGQGEVPEQKCTTCKGAGRARRQDRIPVAIPPGMADGDTFVVEGGGDVSLAPRLGKGGALYVTVHVAPHPRLKRDGDNLWTEEEISFLTLLRGGTVIVKGIDDEALRLKIPHGTPSGKVFRLGGHGLPQQRRNGGSGNRGDLYVTVHARVPSKPSQNLLDTLKGIAEEL